MSAIEKVNTNLTLAHAQEYTREQIDLIKNTVAAGTSDIEFQFFMEVARLQGLNPLTRQIHAVMRWDSRARKEKMVIQTGIDGYRLIAARTGLHLGTTDAVFGPLTKDGFPSSAQVTVKKLVHGHVAEYPATAFWDEYVQTTKEGKPNSMWASRPKGQLAKCAEALALRKAFPAELSGVYTDTEMEQADNPAPEQTQQRNTRPADITREVQQAAGLPERTTQPEQPNEAALQAWATKIGAIADRVRQIAPPQSVADVQAVLDTYNWRSDVTAARACYDDLVALGTRLKEAKEKVQASQQTAAQGDVVDAELLPAAITPGQLKAVQQAANSLGADTSEKRAALWGYWLQHEKPCATKTLTEAEATWILDEKLPKCSPEQRKADLEAALTKFPTT